MEYPFFLYIEKCSQQFLCMFKSDFKKNLFQNSFWTLGPAQSKNLHVHFHAFLVEALLIKYYKSKRFEQYLKKIYIILF